MKGEAAVFRYEPAGLCATAQETGQRRPADCLPLLTWQSSWDSQLHYYVIKAWECVAAKHTQRQLVVQSSRIPAPECSYGSVLAFLKLGKKVLHPISLYQAQWKASSMHQNN